MKLFLTVILILAMNSSSFAQEKTEIEGLNHLSEYIGLRASDFSFREDYTEPDSLRLKVITELMKSPLDMIDYTSQFKSAHIIGQPEILSSVLFQDLARADQTVRYYAYDADLSEIQQSYNLHYTSEVLNQLLQQAALYIDVIIPRSTEAMFSRLSASQKNFLIRKFPSLIKIDENEVFLSVNAIDSLDKLEEEYADRFASYAYLINKDPVVDAGIGLLRQLILELRNIESLLKNNSVSISELLNAPSFVPDNFNHEFNLGKQSGWAIGGTDNDYYNGDYKFIIDFGGDDIYDLTYDPENPHPVVIIDFSGDDSYRSKSDFTLGSGCFSVGILIDLAGNDSYRAKSFAMGSGYFGFGILYDREGDDIYEGDTFLQGAGCYGLGLLIDEFGRDIYSAALSSQGFGFVEGIGLLYDVKGNDNYFAGGKYKDILRYDDHYYSFSQGFAIGMRPIFSGGIGGLIDMQGNDTYTTDIFGQGSSYWWSLGMLYDVEGNDIYNSFQYAQGAGTHMTGGILIDDEGNDTYFSKGVSQGCGHDYSCGILLDRGGNDTYTAYDLSQAAGSANGFGIMIDNNGDDRYNIKNPKNSQGYGNPRREFGSIGLFLDLSGDDQYRGNGKNNYYWKTDSKWGGGMDIELYPKKNSTEENK